MQLHRVGVGVCLKQKIYPSAAALILRMLHEVQVTAEWQEGATARMCVCKILVALAKVSPQAFAPHLQALAAQTEELWDQGRIREGERVQICEGRHP